VRLMISMSGRHSAVSIQPSAVSFECYSKVKPLAAA
jgi:hypothetical protein